MDTGTTRETGVFGGVGGAVAALGARIGRWLRVGLMLRPGAKDGRWS